MPNKSFTKASLIIGTLFLGSLAALPLYTQTADAANLSSVLVTLDRVKAATATGGSVCATPATTATEANVKVTFPSGFTLAAAASWTVTTTNLPNGGTAWPGINTATAVAGQTVTFPSTDLTVGTQYCFNFTGGLTTGSSGNSQVGSVTTTTSAPADIDSSQYALAIVADDQIIVTATVNPIFTFALSGNSDTFSSALSPSSVVSTAGRTVTISTNSDSGWVAWVKSANAALNSASSGGSIVSGGSLNNTPESLTNGANGYGLDVDITTDNATGDGTITQASGYGAEYAGTSPAVGTLSTAFQPIAASNGTTAGDVLTLIERATISAVTPAASDYTDTLTVIGAGRF